MSDNNLDILYNHYEDTFSTIIKAGNYLTIFSILC